MANRKFKIFLIKPSHYDRDGYVIQWRRSSIPSNSLASVYGLLAECDRDKVLGPDVDIEIDACDECNTVVNVKRITREIKKADGGFVGLVGVQSNQFPRAIDIGREFRANGIPVVLGGFHAAGCISMLPELPRRPEGGGRSRHHALCRRGRGPHGDPVAGRRSRRVEADLQLHERPARNGGGDVSDPARGGGRAGGGQICELRCRPRLPVPVLVLHHHQRAGPQVALPHRPTTSRRSSARIRRRA